MITLITFLNQISFCLLQVWSERASSASESDLSRPVSATFRPAVSRAIAVSVQNVVQEMIDIVCRVRDKAAKRLPCRL